MKKRLLITVAALCCCLSASAGNGLFSRLHAGLEWGGSFTVLNHYHYNYLDDAVGFRINEEAVRGMFNLNGYFAGYAGMDVAKELNLSLLLGYESIYDGREVMPLSIRLNWYPSGCHSDGLLFFADTGSGIRKSDSMVKRAQIGTGYRLSLSDYSSLDLRLGIRICHDNPDVWDPVEEEYISRRNILRNDAHYFALNFGLVIEF